MIEFWDRLLGRGPIPMPDGQAAAWIERALESGRPFFAGRLGWLESAVIECVDAGREPEPGLVARLRTNAGVFPEDRKQTRTFVQTSLEALGHADLLAVMNTPHERRLLRRHRRDGLVFSGLAPLEPYLSPNPWSRALKGRQILVVHPFAGSIRNQYESVRERLFSNPDVLPAFDLKTLVPPQTVGSNTGGFSSWDAAFFDLERNVLAVDFDVALIGCGAYGFPLGAAVKRSGRGAVHIGGALQNLFGVAGKRWRDQAPFRELMNDFWRPPMEAERPVGWEKIEDGCYW
ncbi:MAG: hypothetical protein SFU53_03500 [Terrimicrobiaceae bacterium]|nr:hypothetical protein [Terrimicrobiaceae bacterium]